MLANFEIIINAIAAVGVILSVIFLALQIRKNTQAVRASYYDSLNDTNIEFLRQLIEDKVLGKLFEKATLGWNDLGEDDKRTANFLFIQLFRHYENMYYQNKMQVFESWLWDSHRNTLISYFHHDGVQEWWRVRRQTFSDEFRIFLEKSEKPVDAIEMIAELPKK